MKRRKYIPRLLYAMVALLFVPAFLSRCASIMTPDGGPRDSLPPVILSMTPADYSVNCDTLKHDPIYITFDEFVQLKDQQKEFFTSPAMKKMPTVTMRGRGIIIQIKDTLRPNTTYALNFGSSVSDNNEGNPLNSMRYVFSTGPTVDSMMLSGYTADSYKADSVSKSFIWFYPLDSVKDISAYDSTIFNHKPDVIARAENNGIFIARNLKPIPYRIYAIEDTNGNQMYEPGTDQVGFLEGTYNPADLPDFAIWYDSLRRYESAEPQLYFRMFTDDRFVPQRLNGSERPSQHEALLYFTAPRPQIQSIRFDSIPSDKIIVDPQTQGKDTVALWLNVPSASIPDSLKGYVSYMRYNDSLRVLQPTTDTLVLTWQKVESKDEKRKREQAEKDKAKAEKNGEEYVPPKEDNPFKTTLPLTGEINPEENLTADFDYPLAKLDSAVLLLTRTTPDGKIADVPVHVVRDTALLRRWHIVAPWQTGGDYVLTIPAGAITDIAELSNDSLVGKYTVSDPDDYATIKVHVAGRGDGTKYTLQLLDGSNKLLQEKRSLPTGDYSFNYVPAGDIQFRIIEDKNGNGEWDSGNVVEHREPERAEFYTNDAGETTFPTKANWELDITMDMNRIFAPVTMESLIRLLDQREIQRVRIQAEKDAEARAKNKNQNQNNNSNQNNNNTNNSFGAARGMFGGGSSMTNVR